VIDSLGMSSPDSFLGPFFRNRGQT